MHRALVMGRGWEDCISVPSPGRSPSRCPFAHRGAKFDGILKIPSKNAGASLVETANPAWVQQMTRKPLKTRGRNGIGEQSQCGHAETPVKMLLRAKIGEKTILFCLWKSLQSIEKNRKRHGTKPKQSQCRGRFIAVSH